MGPTAVAGCTVVASLCLALRCSQPAPRGGLWFAGCIFSKPWLCAAPAPEAHPDVELSAPGRAGRWAVAAGSWRAARPVLLQVLLCSAREGAPEAPAWLPRAGSSWEAFAAAPGFAGRGALPALASSVVKSRQPAHPWEEPAPLSGAKSAKHEHLPMEFRGVLWPWTPWASPSAALLWAGSCGGQAVVGWENPEREELVGMGPSRETCRAGRVPRPCLHCLAPP